MLVTLILLAAAVAVLGAPVLGIGRSVPLTQPAVVAALDAAAQHPETRDRISREFSGRPSPTPSASPTAAPVAAKPKPKPKARKPAKAPPAGPHVASRIRIPSLGIDLPVVSGNLQVPGNRGSYPLCDVAQYLTVYVQPGRPGTTYIYAHAREGMFLPILRGSWVNDGRGMLGTPITVYTADGIAYEYRLFIVERHITDFSLADSVPPGRHRLVLQTSEGPRGTIPKLQVAAKLLGSHRVPIAEARPRPRPVPCG